MINLAYGAKIRTNDLLIISLLTLPLDQGSRPYSIFSSLKWFWIELNETKSKQFCYGIKLAASL